MKTKYADKTLTAVRSALRYIIALIVLYFVYGETGPATTLVLALMFVQSELVAQMMTAHSQCLDALHRAIGNLQRAVIGQDDDDDGT